MDAREYSTLLGMLLQDGDHGVLPTWDLNFSAFFNNGIFVGGFVAWSDKE